MSVRSVPEVAASSVSAWSERRNEDEAIAVRCRFQSGGQEQRVELRSAGAPSVPPVESDAHHFKERYWGFSEDPFGETLAYRVDHPLWKDPPT